MNETTCTVAGLARGVRATWSLAVSVTVYGMVFGVLAREVGMEWADATLMSALVSAGGSQFVALGLWRLPLPIPAIVLTALVVNLRHILMGAALSPRLRHLSKKKIYVLAFFISDESWALTMREFSDGRSDACFLLGSGLTLFPAWVGSTALGHLLGTAVPDPAHWGLDFAFTAVFSALLVGMWQGVSSLWPWAAAAGVALLSAHWLPGQWYILLGGLTGGLIGAVRYRN